MKLYNPFKYLKKYEWALWIISITVILISSIFSGSESTLNIIASLIGVTALIFVAKGDVFGQIITVIFSIFYGIISFKMKYYGEMITYLGMTAPIAMATVISWIKHPFNDTNEVKVEKLSKTKIILLFISTTAVTIAFYFILKALGNENLIASTVSIATSFSACYLQFFRSPYYAVAYSANDIVLIVLWIMASLTNKMYIPMVICFLMFLINDLYGFYNWIKMKKKQNIS